MGQEKIEGIVLHSIAYGENSRIIKVFSKEHGLISLMIKNLSPKRPMLFSLSTPLTHGMYWIRWSSTHDLYSVNDLSLIEDHFSIRKEAEPLNGALEMIQALLFSQMPGKPSEALFSLFSSYINKLTQVADPSCLSLSFLLKLLLHDGIIRLLDICSICGEPMRAFSLGECFCPLHAPSCHELFSDKEKAELLTLAYSRSFQEIEKLKIEPMTKEKIRNIFKSCQH